MYTLASGQIPLGAKNCEEHTMSVVSGGDPRGEKIAGFTQ